MIEIGFEKGDPVSINGEKMAGGDPDHAQQYGHDNGIAG